MGRKRVAEDEEDYSEEIEASEEDHDMDDFDSAPAGPGTKRAPIYNVDALHDKLEDFGWTEEADWEETLAITQTEPTVVQNVDDDLARELAFYNQALASTQQAITRFNERGVPWLRPVDYYAEMVKTDEHMAKVKEQLMAEQRQIEEAEERRKQREQKLYGKQLQAEKRQQKNADKKRQIESISKLRKQREKSGFAGELDVDAELDNLSYKAPNMKKLGQRMPGRGGPGAANKKRMAKNAKYGFGGKKGLSKQNDAYSAADMDGYKPGKFKEHLGAKGGVKKGNFKGKKQQQKRPGKANRQKFKGKHGR